MLPRLCRLDASLDVTIFYSGSTLQPLPEHARIQAVRLPPVEQLFRPGRLFMRQGAGARRLLAQRRLDPPPGTIWHSTYYTCPDDWPGPQVVTVHDLILERFPALFDRPWHADLRRRKRQAARQADAILCNSQATLDDLVGLLGAPPERCRVIRHACSPLFRPSQAPPPAGEKPFLLYVGARQRHKNFDFLLHALSGWSRRGEIELVAAGAPWSAGELRRLDELGLAGDVRLEPDPSDEGLCSLYQRALGLVFPSLYEGFGLPLLEAMQSGCPLVASRIPSTLEVAGDVPLYFEPGSLDSLLGALDVLVSEGRDSGRRRLGLEQARQFSWDKTAAGILEVYRELAG